MARGTDTNVNGGAGRASMIGRTASAANDAVDVIGMSVRFHGNKECATLSIILQEKNTSNTPQLPACISRTRDRQLNFSPFDSILGTIEKMGPG